MFFESFKHFKLNLFFPKIRGSAAPMYEPPLIVHVCNNFVYCVVILLEVCNIIILYDHIL